MNKLPHFKNRRISYQKRRVVAFQLVHLPITVLKNEIIIVIQIKVYPLDLLVNIIYIIIVLVLPIQFKFQKSTDEQSQLKSVRIVQRWGEARVPVLCLRGGSSVLARQPHLWEADSSRSKPLWMRDMMTRSRPSTASTLTCFSAR